MSLTRKLASHEPSIIKDALFYLLNKTTAQDVIELDNKFILADDKHAFLANFEASDSAPPKLDPALLERWTHYRWIRLELTYLINQKAALNHITDIKNKVEALHDAPAMQDSIDRAIQEDALNDVNITDSINLLKQMSLQIIGTEHPTDPLSQEARDLLLKLAQAIDKQKPQENEIIELFQRLQTVDAIPPKKRSVEEEVHRNIKLTLDKLYDNVPQFIQTILHAYKKYYGEELTKLHENNILAAMEGSKTSPPLLRDGAWPGFDADGNTNVTATTMKNAIRLHRIRAAEKHSAALEATVIETAKKIERDLREAICQLNLKLFDIVNDLDNQPKNVRLTVVTFQNEASRFLIDRKFSDLLKHYESFNDYIRSLEVETDKKTELNEIIDKQLAHARTLVQLIQFSGTCSLEKPQSDEDNHSPRPEYIQQQGDLQAFIKILSNHKDDVRENSDAIHIENIPASLFMQTRFHATLKKHDALFKLYPELYLQMRYFGVQLHCFGMTYGVGHVRQDSSVFIDVWNAILDDLKADPTFFQYTLFKRIHEKTYSALNVDERLALHKQLQDGSAESKHLLKTIFNKHKRSKYSLEQKYKHTGFDNVRAELERIDLALKHDDMFENIIISNCESAANILEVESLLSIFPKRAGQQPLRVVPLLEKREDLEKFECILTDYVKMKAQQPIENRTVEIMVGFSDTERVSGIPALISIQQVKENFIKLANRHGVTPKIYHGPGGDPNRGGLKRRDQKATLQGNARSNALNTATSTQWYRENQFYHTHQLLADPYKAMELTHLPAQLQEALKTFTQAGTAFYEELHDVKNGFGKLTSLLLGQGAQWMVTILNSSSRATQRGTADNTGDRTASIQTDGFRPESYVQLDKLRAITATQAKEMLRDNINFVGAGHGLRTIGQALAEQLYFSSETFRDVVEKTLLGEATRDLTFISHALFADYPELQPRNQKELKIRASICRTTDPTLLKSIDIKVMSENPAHQKQLLNQLSYFLAYLQEESQLTCDFLFKLKHSIHAKTRNVTTDTLAHPTDLLFHAPEWQAQTRDLINEVEPFSYLFARQSHHVARGKNLDQVYLGLNEQTLANSLLSGIGRLLGNIGSAITAFRQMQPGFTENVHHDYRPNLRMGVMRAETEKHSMTLFSVKNHMIKPELNEIMQKAREKIKKNSPMR